MAGSGSANSASSSPRPTLGIDLGTTNCALARCLPSPEPATVSGSASEAAGGASVLPIAQLTNPGEVRSEPLLPSSLYLAGEKEFAEGALQLPWPHPAHLVIGELAKKRGAEASSRLVHSAKSWLSYAGVDRTAALLPATAPEGVARLSPLEASRLYLQHLRQAFLHAHPEANWEEHDVLVTVPASFDAGARDLTLQAARLAGLGEVILLEEPQAAFYAWMERHPDWRERVQPGNLILVVDIGGGTTDFTLIRVADEAGSLTLERVAVGEHILLGGDNVDLALARLVEAELSAKNTRLDAQQLHQLWQRCRAAKEKLLDPASTQAEEPVTILGRGTGLIGGTIKATLRRADLEKLLLDGFLPQVERTDLPAAPRRSGLQEVGLPYAADAAITRHLAKFLSQQAGSAFAAPTHVLFNGGMLRAPLVRHRLMEVLNGWLTAAGQAPAQLLEGEDLMHAVARGAAYFGQARQGRGIRIRGGVSRSYYIGIASAMPAVPGFPAPMKALTVVPFGLEEGSSVQLPKHEFSLITGQPAEFRFFSSASRHQDQPGDLLDPIPPGLEEASPVEIVLPGEPGKNERVRLEAQVTETGVLQLYCVPAAAGSTQKWKLEHNVRERAAQ